MKYFRISCWKSPTMKPEHYPPKKYWKEESIHPRFGYQYHFWFPRLWWSRTGHNDSWYNEGCVRLFWLHYVVNFGFGRDGPKSLSYKKWKQVLKQNTPKCQS